ERDDAVGERRCDDFPAGLEDVLRDSHVQHLFVRPDAIEGDHVEQRRIDRLAHHRGPDDARPQPFPFRRDLHLRQRVAVGKAAAPECDERPRHDARRVAEHVVQALLITGHERRYRQRQHDQRHERREDQRSKTRPHHAPVASVAVHLGEDVAKDVRDREEQHARAKCDRPEDRQRDLRRLGRTDQVRAQQHRDEGGHDEVVIAEVARRTLDGHGGGSSVVVVIPEVWDRAALGCAHSEVL
ncbi:hypothetical protein COLO4_00133, partial [Corchorus olitorius]